MDPKSRKVVPHDPKLLKIHLRHHPPGILLEYLDAFGKKREKTLDLVDLSCGTLVDKLCAEVLQSEPLFCTHKHQLKLRECLHKLVKVQWHDYSKRYLHFQTIKPHSLPLTDADLSKDGLRCATTCLGNAGKVWNTQTGREITTLIGHEDSITSIHFDCTGERLLTSSHDGTLRHWRLDSDNITSCTQVLHCDRRNRDHHSKHRFLFAKYSPDFGLSLSASDAGTALIHDLNGGALCYKFCPDLSPKEELTCLNMDKTSTLLVASPHARTKTALFDLRSGELTDSLESHRGQVTKSVFDFGGHFIATGSWDCAVKVWDVRMTKEAIKTLGCESEILDIEFDPRGKSLLAGCASGKIYVWHDITTGPSSPGGKLLFEKQVQKCPVTKVVWSPNSALVLALSETGTVRLYNSELGSPIQTLPDHTRPIVGAAFSYNSELLMTASKDKTVRIHKHTLV